MDVVPHSVRGHFKVLIGFITIQYLMEGFWFRNRPYHSPWLRESGSSSNQIFRQFFFF